MKNNESLEMYLETILELQNEKKDVHAIDIANKLSYSKPSVSRAMKILVNEEYIKIDEKQIIHLTDKGLKKSNDIYERHCVLTKMLISLGADKKLAEENACRIEHVISDDLFEIIKKKYY